MQYHGYDTYVSTSGAKLLRIHTDDRHIKSYNLLVITMFLNMKGQIGGIS